jgi:hypothetical protein
MLHKFPAEQVTFPQKLAMHRKSFSRAVVFSQYSTQQMQFVWARCHPRVSFVLFFSYENGDDHPSKIYVTTD